MTPRLEQEISFSETWEAKAHGIGVNISGPAIIQLIPWETVELDFGVPAYVARSKYEKGDDRPTHGFDYWSDVSFRAKYRLLAADDEHGNYAASLFVDFLAPTGPKQLRPDNASTTPRQLGSGHAIFTPGIAFGKGWGKFDFQSVVDVAFPNGGEDRLGMPLSYDTAVQYQVLKFFWPELEVNYTWWPNGERTGNNQVFLIPGLMLGRFDLWKQLKIDGGFGYQVAVTKNPEYNHAWIVQAALLF